MNKDVIAEILNLLEVQETLISSLIKKWIH
jgi:hypothetical protein